MRPPKVLNCIGGFFVLQIE